MGFFCLFEVNVVEKSGGNFNKRNVGLVFGINWNKICLGNVLEYKRVMLDEF